MSDRPEDDAYYERRARELGLPTDPEAYQEGGFAEACSAITLPEAEMLASHLKTSGIPAWVDTSLSATYAEGRPQAYIPVLVPAGRLAEAQELIERHRPAEPAPSEAKRMTARGMAALVSAVAAGVGLLLLGGVAVAGEGRPGAAILGDLGAFLLYAGMAGLLIIGFVSQLKR
jgi:hypothetical protein